MVALGWGVALAQGLAGLTPGLALPKYSIPMTKKRVPKRYLQLCIKDYCIPHPYCRSICIDNRSIGFVIIMPQSGDDQCRADVGHALSAEYWGHGIATRAVKMAINEGLKEFQDSGQM